MRITTFACSESDKTEECRPQVPWLALWLRHLRRLTGPATRMHSPSSSKHARGAAPKREVCPLAKTCSFLHRGHLRRANDLWGRNWEGSWKLALARHLQTYWDASSRSSLDPSHATVAIYAAHEGLQTHERPKAHTKLPALYATLGDGYHVGGPAKAPDERRLRRRKRAYGRKVLLAHAGCWHSQHVSGPDGLSLGDPGAARALENHTVQRKRLRHEARAQEPLADGASGTAPRPEDEV